MGSNTNFDNIRTNCSSKKQILKLRPAAPCMCTKLLNGILLWCPPPPLSPPKKESHYSYFLLLTGYLLMNRFKKILILLL